jgi:tRNA-(ms[2]io[6]A)-hydroxylase
MLGLLVASDPAWGRLAVQDMSALLVDHAHCEMKAASNALSLIARHGGMADVASANVIMALTHLAQEEMEHFRLVLDLLQRRGVSLGPPPVDEYAQQLRSRTAALPWGLSRPRERARALIDRLLVASLIEARSAERFKLIMEALDPGSELHSLYGELFASEARHHRDLVDLARDVAGDDAPVTDRLQAFARLEADVVRGLPASGRPATIHG